ncbi:hypothetical protein CALCODRAFT_182395 [Calocera cornea HHB12733]|uniref:Uncharacterized protein n=1 Tax=Calocera cornea HHB12733 TaxID=1353952 RepID=A0A165HS18_9BASI|nr:hypothetical protein CALCODRAFT_182395 [Calocera cornea HHB12733]
MSNSCTIDANPDIAGIGVRVSIYIQALLAIIPAAVALYQYGMTHTTVKNFGVNGEADAIREYHHQTELWRRDPQAAKQHLRDLYESASKQDRAVVRGAWLAVQVTGAALLISAFIQVKLYGLDLYHALIVINLSWISHMTALGLALTELFLADPVDFFFGWGQKSLKQLLPYILCSLHLTATAAFGLWVFSNIDDFGGNAGCNSDIHYWVFGHQVSATNPHFRKAGLVISGLAICPNINLQLEILFSGLVGFLLSLPGLIIHIVVVIILVVILLLVTKLCLSQAQKDKLTKFLGDLGIHNPMRRVYGQAMPYALMIMLFIIATEELIVVNRELVSDGENDWTFGQTLAMFVLLPVILDVISKLRRASRLGIVRAKAFSQSETEPEDDDSESAA